MALMDSSPCSLSKVESKFGVCEVSVDFPWIIALPGNIYFIIGLGTLEQEECACVFCAFIYSSLLLFHQNLKSSTQARCVICVLVYLFIVWTKEVTQMSSAFVWIAQVEI